MHTVLLVRAIAINNAFRVHSGERKLSQIRYIYIGGAEKSQVCRMINQLYGPVDDSQATKFVKIFFFESLPLQLAILW